MAEASPPASLWGREVLSEREELLREAEQIAHVGSWAWDMKTGTVAWSDELYRILGRDPASDKATYENFIEAIHPDDRDAVQQLAARAMQGDVAERAEYRVVRRDGTEREIAGLAQIFKDENGTPVRMVGVAMDVTEVRRLEQDLRQAQKMEALGRIAGGLAHDFNNLLTVILLNISALKRQHPASREVVQIEDASASAAALATQLLAFSRRSPRVTRVLDANTIAVQSASMIERLLGENIRIVLAPSKEPATVVADEAQLHQVILNLALNARDAMPQGGDIFITLDRTDRARGVFIRISVRDTGTGMSQATRARLFEPFFTTKEPGKGTGLGLASVFGIVSQSGGFLEVASEEGRGSTFNVFLPLAAEVVREERREETRGALVMVVEDSDDVRTAIARILIDAGYEVIEAGLPSQALSQLTDRVSVVVSDVVMPEMSGRELVEQMRKKRPDLPVIFITGYDPESEKATPDRVWCLAKPINPARFLEQVREAAASR